MNRKLILAAVALAGTFAATASQAHTNVQWSVTVGSPGVVVGLPVPVLPRPVVVAPPHRVVVPGPVVYPARWDRDGDGIPNRYDRVYNPRWDRDGDGVPNRYDRHDNRWHHHHHHHPYHGR